MDSLTSKQRSDILALVTNGGQAALDELSVCMIEDRDRCITFNSIAARKSVATETRTKMKAGASPQDIIDDFYKFTEYPERFLLDVVTHMPEKDHVDILTAVIAHRCSGKRVATDSQIAIAYNRAFTHNEATARFLLKEGYAHVGQTTTGNMRKARYKIFLKDYGNQTTGHYVAGAPAVDVAFTASLITDRSCSIVKLKAADKANMMAAIASADSSTACAHISTLLTFPANLLRDVVIKSPNEGREAMKILAYAAEHNCPNLDDVSTTDQRLRALSSAILKKRYVMAAFIAGLSDTDPHKLTDKNLALFMKHVRPNMGNPVIEKTTGPVFVPIVEAEPAMSVPLTTKRGFIIPTTDAKNPDDIVYDPEDPIFDADLRKLAWTVFNITHLLPPRIYYHPHVWEEGRGITDIVE